MNKTYIITMADGKTRSVTGKGRNSAAMKITGWRAKRAVELGLIQKIEEAQKPPTTSEEKP